MGRVLGVAVRSADGKAVGGLMHAATPQDEVVRLSVGEMVAASFAYQKAMRSAFGEAAAGRFGVTAVDEGRAWERVTAIGHSLRVPMTMPPVELDVMRSASGWRIGVPAALKYLNAKGIPAAIPGDEPLRRLSQAAEAMRDAARQINAGRFATAVKAADAARQAVDDAMAGRGFD